jgi:uncharacterized OB-fold protein
MIYMERGMDRDRILAEPRKAMPGAPARALPYIDQDNEAYWTGGEVGELRIYRCQACKYYVHPPVQFCPKCDGRDVKPEAVSGNAKVTSFTVNHKQWVPGLPERFVLALVTIDEQDDVQLPTNIVNCDPESVTMGMPVQVLFEQAEDLWIPLFEPRG